MGLLKTLRDELHMGIILVSHDIGMVARHVDNIVCLAGKLHFHGSSQQINVSDIEKTFEKALRDEMEIGFFTIGIIYSNR